MITLESLLIPIVKIVGDFCNLRCRYCFYHCSEQSNNSIMSLDLLEKFIGEFLAIAGEKPRFIWHGGEPLLAGIHFFEKIIEF